MRLASRLCLATVPLLALVLFQRASWSQTTIVASRTPTPEHRLLGLPDYASPSGTNHVLYDKAGYSASFNKGTGTVNWWSYKFGPDSDMIRPSSLPDIDSLAYLELEHYVDGQLKVDPSLKGYVITGPIMNGGKMTQIWEIAILLPKGNLAQQGPVRKNAFTGHVVQPDYAQAPHIRIVSALMPNDPKADPDFRKYLTSPAFIQSQTGLKFFSSYPVQIRELLIQQIDSGK